MKPGPRILRMRTRLFGVRAISVSRTPGTVLCPEVPDLPVARAWLDLRRDLIGRPSARSDA